MTNLTPNEVLILETLDETGGFTTHSVAQRTGIKFGHNNRTRGAAIRSWLMQLRAAGLVQFLDDKKPVCWQRTPAGTKKLSEARLA